MQHLSFVAMLCVGQLADTSSGQRSVATVTAETGEVTGASLGGSLSTGWWSNGMKAWGGKGEFIDVPEWLVGANSLVPGADHWGGDVAYSCPSKRVFPWIEACEAFVFVYRCPPCPGSAKDIESALLPKDWSPSSCAPRFTIPSSTHQFRMLAFRKQFLPGTTIKFTIPAADYVAFAASSAGTRCAASTASKCMELADAHYQACAWDPSTESCVHTNYCPKPHGPFPPPAPYSTGSCTVCPPHKV
eukprot:TRINITY_DN17705_c0_g1_i1.p1 TRINITY_DN17705_c0_g1~~TRINITY_DN17705_c0_g1_i1.p1  ORF type:complete len:267 (+),score=43.89 TRINITY_DN17705_c0_g1_i1:69-803(+)